MAKHRQRREQENRRQLRQAAARRARRAAASDASFSLERLEPRQLLAITITDQNLAGFKVGADYVIADSESITVAPNLLIDAAGGKISLTAPSISIGAGATLRSQGTGGAADGAITLTAKSQTTQTPSALLNTVVNWAELALSGVGLLPGQAATIDVGSNVRIDGGTVRLDVAAGDVDPQWWKDLTKTPLGGKILKQAAKALDAIVALPITVVIKQPESRLTVAEDVSITGSGSVTLASEAVARADGVAMWSVAADYLNLLKFTKKVSFAAGLAYSDAVSTLRVAENTLVESTAAGVSLTSRVDNSTTIKSRAHLNTGLKPLNADNVSFSAAVAIQNSKATVDLAAESLVKAATTVEVRATGTDINLTRARTASFKDGLVGATAAVAVGSSIVEVFAGGTIEAGQTAPPAAVAFDPATTVDFATSTIRLAAATELVTGEPVVYSTGGGAAIPALDDGESYYAIVDAADARNLRLALSSTDAAKGRAISFGPGFPTLSAGAKGTLPIIAIASESDTEGGLNVLELDATAWPDGAAFVDGEQVSFAGVAGRFVGVQSTSGQLVGRLVDGSYRIKLLPTERGTRTTRLQLLDATDLPIRLTTAPFFTTAAGTWLEVAAFDADLATITLADPAAAAGLANGAALTYVEGFAAAVAELADATRYYAIVDADAPGTLQLARTQAQARAADPAVQAASPTLEFTVPPTEPEGEPETAAVPILGLDGVTSIAFPFDPGIADGTAVTYRAAAGKPVGRLVDGTTYYAYRQVNPTPDADLPAFLYGLRATADAAAAWLDLAGGQSLETADGTQFAIEGVDMSERLLAVSLPIAPLPVVDSDGLSGGTATVAEVAAGSILLTTTATGGSFVLQADAGGRTISTRPIAWDASAADLRNAVNDAGILGIVVATATGQGSLVSPWLLEGTGLTDLRFDAAGLEGGSLAGEFTLPGLRKLSTSATAGSFRVGVDRAGTTRSSGPIAFNATTAGLAAALQGIDGVQAVLLGGSGTAAAPWLIDARINPLATGTSLTFRDAFGQLTLGLPDGTAYAAVPLPPEQQLRQGSLVLGLALAAEEAAAARPDLLPLDTVLEFSEPVAFTMVGRAHALAPLAAGSITIAAELTANDTGRSGAKNGGQPGFMDRLRPDMALVSGGRAGLLKLILSGGLSALKDFGNQFSSAINNNVGNQQIAGAGAKSWSDVLGLSASVNYLQGTRTVRTIIGPQAVLRTPGTIVVDTTLTEQFRTEAKAKVSKPKATRVAVAVAVNVAFVETVSQSIVRSGARLTGGQGVSIDAGVRYPLLERVVDGTLVGLVPELEQNLFGTGSFTDIAEGIDNLVKLPLDAYRVRDGFHEVSAESGADQKDYLAEKVPKYKYLQSIFTDYQKNRDAVVKNAVAGSVQTIFVDNRCEAIVEDGVQINRDPTVPAGTEQPVAVRANSVLTQLAWTGGGTKKVENGLGFSVAVYTFGDTTRAVIGGTNTLADAQRVQAAAATAAIAPSEPTRITLGGGGLTVDATHWGTILALAKGGAEATGWVFSGMATVLDGQSRKQTLEAAITAPAAGVEIARREGTAGKVSVAAADYSYLIPVAGTSVSGAEKLVGVATAIALLDRDVTARIGERPAMEATQIGGIVLDVGGDVRVDATAGGAIAPAAIAGGTKSAKNTFQGEGEFAGDEWWEVREAFRVRTPISINRFGIGATGAVAIADIDDTVTATVHHTGTMTTAAANKLGVAATNTTTILANTGSLALRTAAGEEKLSAGLSGAVSLILAGSHVEASIRRATIDGFAIDVAATNTRSIGTAAASGAGGAVGGAGSVTVNFAGSVAIQSLTTTTLATLDRVTGTSLAGASVVATSDDLVWNVAGSFVGNASSKLVRKQYRLGGSLSGADNGRSLAVGASVAVLNATANTKATVTASNLSFAERSLEVQATEQSTVITASGGGSFVSTGGTATPVFATKNNAGSSVAGFVAVANVDPTVEASITDSTVVMADAGGDVSVLATTAMLLVTASGGFVLNRDGNGTLSTSIGAAVTVVNSTTRGTATISRSRVTVSKGKVRVRATSGNPADAAWSALDPIFSQLNMPEAGAAGVWSFAVGAVASDSTLTVAASVNVTSLDVHLAATIADDSEVVAAAGSVEVTAINELKIRTVAGSVATTALTSDRSSLSAGAALLFTNVGGGVTASITSASVTAGTDAAGAESGRVVVTAADRADILTIAAAGVLSGENALSTALVFNDLTGRTISATITGTDGKRSTVAASKGVTVTAVDETSLTAVAGQVAIPASTAATIAAGAAGSVNRAGADVTAAIEQAAVTSAGGDITVETVVGGMIRAWAVGVSGALSSGSGESLVGALPVSFVGAGSFALNTVVNRSTAAVRGAAAVTARSLTVTADDSGEIFAVAGALAAQGSDRTVSVAAGVSVAVNEIGTATDRGRVQAMIDGATVALAGGDLTVAATNDATITSWTIAGTGQVAKSDAVAVGLAGAGAGNTNRVHVDTVAAISGSASVTTDQAVTVTATDTSKVDSNAGGAGLGVVLGQAAAVGVTVGAARSVVEITNSVRAAIDTGSVSAGGNVTVSAHSSQRVDALAFGVGINVAVASGAAGVSAAGSGAESTVSLATTTTAEIVSATVAAGVSGDGSVRVRANDTPTLATWAGAGSLVLAYGTAAGLGLAAGVVLDENTLANTVTARIGTSDKPAPTVTASGSVDATAASAATATTHVVAVAVSAAFSPSFIAGAAAVAYAKSTTTITNTITSEIAAGSVAAAAVTVSAGGGHSATSTVGVGAVVLTIVGGSVGWSTSEAIVNDTVAARISGGTVTGRAGDVAIEAGSGNTLATRSVATSLALALGGGGTAGSATSKDTSSVTAEVGSDARVAAEAGTLQVRVGGVPDSGGQVGYGKVAAKSDGGSLGLITVGRVSASAEHAQTRLAVVRDGASLANVAALEVDAQSSPDVKAESFAVDVGVGYAVQDNESLATVRGSTKAETGTGVTLPGAVRITADAVTSLAADQRGGTGGGLVGGGGNDARATSAMAVEASLGASNAAAAGERVELLRVAADHRDTSTVYALAGAGGIGGGIASTSATLVDTTSTSATIAATTAGQPLAVGTLVVSAEREQAFATQADSYYGGLIGVGIPSAAFTTTATAETTVAAAADIDASGTVLLRSDNVVRRTGSDLAARVAGGGVVSGGGGGQVGQRQHGHDELEDRDWRRGDDPAVGHHRRHHDPADERCADRRRRGHLGRRRRRLVGAQVGDDRHGGHARGRQGQRDARRRGRSGDRHDLDPRRDQQRDRRLGRGPRRREVPLGHDRDGR